MASRVHTLKKSHFISFHWRSRVCTDNFIYVAVSNVLAVYNIKPPVDDAGNQIPLKANTRPFRWSHFQSGSYCAEYVGPKPFRSSMPGYYLSNIDRLRESPLKSSNVSMRSFRYSSILSYHLAASRDIALQLAEQEIQIETLSSQRTLESAKWGLEPTWTVQCCHSAFSGSATALLCM